MNRFSMKFTWNYFGSTHNIELSNIFIQCDFTSIDVSLHLHIANSNNSCVIKKITNRILDFFNANVSGKIDCDRK